MSEYGGGSQECLESPPRQAAVCLATELNRHLNSTRDPVLPSPS